MSKGILNEKLNGLILNLEAQALIHLRKVNLENENLKVTVAQTEQEFEIMKREIEEEKREFYSKQTRQE